MALSPALPSAGVDPRATSTAHGPARGTAPTSDGAVLAPGRRRPCGRRGHGRSPTCPTDQPTCRRRRAGRGTPRRRRRRARPLLPPWWRSPAAPHAWLRGRRCQPPRTTKAQRERRALGGGRRSRRWAPRRVRHEIAHSRLSDAAPQARDIGRIVGETSGDRQAPGARGKRRQRVDECQQSLARHDVGDSDEAQRLRLVSTNELSKTVNRTFLDTEVDKVVGGRAGDDAGYGSSHQTLGRPARGVGVEDGGVNRGQIRGVR